MIADKSTTNLIFFYFFSPVYLADAQLQESKQLFVLSSGRRLRWIWVQGLQLRNRTIAPIIPSSRGPEPHWQHLLSGTGRTIARNPDSCDTCWAPTTRTIIRFLVRTQAGQPPDTEQLFGLAAKPGWAGTRKANNGWFLRVWWQPEARSRSSGQTRARKPEAPPQVNLLFCGRYIIMLYL